MNPSLIKRILLITALISVGIIGALSYRSFFNKANTGYVRILSNFLTQDDQDGPPADEKNTHPLQIEQMRKKEYPGGDIIIEQTLPPGSNYDRYIVSYKSDGLKIYALLTIPPRAKTEKRLASYYFQSRLYSAS